jgi:hypothetical protein
MECVHPSLDAQSMCTYSGVCNTMECVCSFFGKQSSRTTQVRAKLNQNLVPMTHQPICTFTFSFTIGVGLGVLHSPPPYLCIVLSALYTHVHTKTSKVFKKMWVLCLHSILVLPSCILRTVPGPLDLY